MVSAQSGYTLFEIMLVLSIIALLAGSAIFLVGGVLDDGKEIKADSDIKTLRMQLDRYASRNYTAPSTAQGLDALVSMPSGDPKPKRWKKLMDEVPLDPWGNEYVYRKPGKLKPEGYDLFSLGPDGTESDDDIGK
jgi:general secretion pathway protein G